MDDYSSILLVRKEYFPEDGRVYNFGDLLPGGRIRDGDLEHVPHYDYRKIWRVIKLYPGESVSLDAESGMIHMVQKDYDPQDKRVYGYKDIRPDGRLCVESAGHVSGHEAGSRQGPSVRSRLRDRVVGHFWDHAPGRRRHRSYSRGRRTRRESTPRQASRATEDESSCHPSSSHHSVSPHTIMCTESDIYPGRCQRQRTNTQIIPRPRVLNSELSRMGDSLANLRMAAAEEYLKSDEGKVVTVAEGIKEVRERMKILARQLEDLADGKGDEEARRAEEREEETDGEMKAEKSEGGGGDAVSEAAEPVTELQ